MKIGLNMLLYTGHVTEAHFEILEYLAEAGYDCVEIPVNKLDDASYKRLSQKLRALGLECSVSYALPQGASFISPEKSMRDKALLHSKRVVDTAGILGANIIMGPFYQPLGAFSGAGPTDDEKARCLEGHRLFAEYAEKHSIILAMEVLNRFECYMFNLTEQGHEHIKKIGSPNLKLTYDTFHANIEEKRPLEVLEKYFDDIVHVHISENDRGIIGEGHNPIVETISLLERRGYCGMIVVEAFGCALKELAAATCCWRSFFKNQRECAISSLAYLKQISGSINASRRRK